jgi:rubrerythrin
MKSLKGSQTEQNLITAFAGESQARNRYTYFASKARQEGLIQVAQVFEETANQEKEHAKRFFSQLQGGETIVQAAFPAGIVGGTMANLTSAAAGERMEWNQIYPEFARIAREEGFSEAAIIWDAVSVAEKQHEKRYSGLLANLESGRMFKRDTPVVWRCINCGYLHEGFEAPQQCPACAHPQGYYELLGENW